MSWLMECLHHPRGCWDLRFFDKCWECLTHKISIVILAHNRHHCFYRIVFFFLLKNAISCILYTNELKKGKPSRKCMAEQNIFSSRPLSHLIPSTAVCQQDLKLERRDNQIKLSEKSGSTYELCTSQ